MSFLSKLKFWKHDDLDFDSLTDKDMTPTDPMPQDDISLTDPVAEEKSPFPTTEPSQPFQSRLPQQDRHPMQAAQVAPQMNDLQLINSKLDTIKALLNSMDQRLMHLENNKPKQEKLW